MPVQDTSFMVSSTPIPACSRPASSQKKCPPSALPASATKQRKKVHSPTTSAQGTDLAAQMEKIKKMQAVVHSKMTATSQQHQGRRDNQMLEDEDLN